MHHTSVAQSRQQLPGSWILKGVDHSENYGMQFTIDYYLVSRLGHTDRPNILSCHDSEDQNLANTTQK